MSHKLWRSVALPAAGALMMVSCGGGGSASPTSPTAPSPSTVAVTIVSSIGNTAFVPNPVRANTGDTVVFRNTDTVAHRLVLDDGSTDLGDVAPGGTSRGFVLRSSSETKFRCTLHASMVGSINGAVAPEPSCVPDEYGYCP